MIPVSTVIGAASALALVACDPVRGRELEPKSDGGSGGAAESGVVADGDSTIDSDMHVPPVPAGYPPAHCVPPCLWELFVDCGVPGTSPERPRDACVWDQAGYAACDSGRSFLTSEYQTYVDVEVCFTSRGVSGPTSHGMSLLPPLPQLQRYVDRDGRVVADEALEYDWQAAIHRLVVPTVRPHGLLRRT